MVLAAFPCKTTDYYVSPSGDDAKLGTSSKPWKAIAKVHSVLFKAGDRIFFLGGSSFSGGLVFDRYDAGTPTNPIMVSSYRKRPFR